MKLKFDLVSFFLTLIISLVGLIFIYSATTPSSSQIIFSALLKKQFFGLLSGILIYLIFAKLSYGHLCYWGYSAYFLVILLLVFTKIKGAIGMGAQRWISLIFFRFQPSELTKLFLPAYITHYLKTVNSHPVYKFKTFIPLLMGLFLSFILILKQPDLGTASLILFSGLIVFWLAGLKTKFFVYSLLILTISGPITWNILRDYQKQRIKVFMGLGNKSKEGYQITQSKIAIGSGGILGKGFKKGTQNKLNFLPESQTDFIFSVICEEFGYLGALILLILYLLLFLRLYYLILQMPNFFSRLLAIGLLSHIALSTIINISMVTGLLPIVGIPLPLVSYGISNLWITMASLGWINGISSQSRKEYSYAFSLN